MPDVIENSIVKHKCQIFTPACFVNQMLDLADYNTDLFGKKVLENSCGNGEILLQIVKRYIDFCKERGFSNKKIKTGLEEDIFAYEIDSQRIEECKMRLDTLALRYNIKSVKWNIYCEDFLTTKIKERFDFIVGNPPYIAYPDLPKNVRENVRKEFNTCKKGKFDYSYAFIEKSYELLKREGVLVYIIPSNIFKNVFASEIRRLIKGDLCEIIDYPSEKVFENVLVSPSIIKVVKGCNIDFLSYKIGNINKTIIKTDLMEKWNFRDVGNISKKRIGDYFRVSSAVATLLNKVFVIKDPELNGDFYMLNNFKFEKNILKKAASPKNKRHNKHNEFIIFPYYFDNDGNLKHYTEKEMLKFFPCTMKYLKKNKKKLKKRDVDKNVKWYEFGRTQALRNMNKDKILISSIVSGSTQAYFLDKDEIPYSGLYIIPISDIPLSKLISIINSDSFKEYVDGVGISVRGSSKRLTPKDIENYTF